MTCEQCLSALETESLREMSADSPVMQHCATCPDCARVTTMVRDKEYETATVLNSLPPMSDPLAVAETAGLTDQRRRVGGIVVMLSAIGGAIVIWIVSATMVVPGLYRAGVIGNAPPATGVRTETMQLSCLSPQQAADVIDPYIKGRNSRFYVPNSGLSAITVRGTPEELAKSRDLITKFERDPNAACRATATRLRNTMESVDQAFKDANRDRDAAPSKGPPTGNEPGLLGPTTGPTLLTPDKATTPPKKK
jgi:hypothetical protein